MKQLIDSVQFSSHKCQLFLMLLLTGVLSSCEKISPESNQSSQYEIVNDNNTRGAENSINDGQIFEENGVLCFRTIGYYESIVNYKDDSKTRALIGFVAQSSFISFGRTYPEDTVFEDDFMWAILNPDRIVKIGEWFIKINPGAGEVLAVQDSSVNAYTILLTENRSDAALRIFSIHDDVLDILQLGHGPAQAACSEQSADPDSQKKGWFEYCSNFELKFVARYDNWGIYRKLKLEWWHNHKGGSDDNVLVSFGYHYEYDQKCGSENANVTVALNISPFNFETAHKEIVLYQKTKALESYLLSSQFGVGGAGAAYRRRCDLTTGTIVLDQSIFDGP